VAQAEKMRRQKLYSNVIREQNKKISRIPFLPAARNAVGSNNKDNMVPRRKVTEKETERIRNRKRIREKIRGRERGREIQRLKDGNRERKKERERKKSEREYIASSASISPRFPQSICPSSLSVCSITQCGILVSQIIEDNSKQCMSLLHPLGNNRLI
jgi:hypothetical protein